MSTDITNIKKEGHHHHTYYDILSYTFSIIYQKKMEFGERMLKKYGWAADKGLGKDNQGMKTALKPVLKFDQRGVGCNQKDEYSSEFKWWEHTYNRAAQKIADPSQSSEPKEKKRKHEEEKVESKKTVYSRFEKGSILIGNKEESSRLEEEEPVVTETNIPAMPSDEELLRICGGRTAHKGARHGIKMNGKLQRLQEQEEQTDETIEKKKKKKKHKSIEPTE